MPDVETQRFVCVDEEGTEHTVVHVQREETQTSVTGEQQTVISFRRWALLDGSLVEKSDVDSFRVVATGQILRKVREAQLRPEDASELLERLAARPLSAWR
jgi:hypothetical protein